MIIAPTQTNLSTHIYIISFCSSAARSYTIISIYNLDMMFLWSFRIHEYFSFKIQRNFVRFDQICACVMSSNSTEIDIFQSEFVKFREHFRGFPDFRSHFALSAGDSWARGIHESRRNPCAARCRRLQPPRHAELHLSVNTRTWPENREIVYWDLILKVKRI